MFCNGFFINAHTTITIKKLSNKVGRTINTSMTTFIVLLAMFIVGGEAIKGFIFAIMIGVVVGTYSSICIATPSVLDFTKKKDDTKSL